MMGDILEKAIDSVKNAKIAFCKFISANDAGSTGSHQCGFYIPPSSVNLIFDSPGIKGSNKDRFLRIRWQDEFETDSRAIYYGKGTRNEYRVTRFGKNFPYLTDDNVGNLLILNHNSDGCFEGYVLAADEDVDFFLSSFGLTANDTNRLIPKQSVVSPKDALMVFLKEYTDDLKSEFPSTMQISTVARDIYFRTNEDNRKRSTDYDKELLRWLDTEYELFRAIEAKIYGDRVNKQFKSIDELIEFANELLNRRKSRAGRSLENHLHKVFSLNGLSFSHPCRTEGNKLPDFIFPGSVEYHDKRYVSDKLVFLGAKTTCKDRWRQILNEADRIPVKHLFTLQQGISSNQLEEMCSNHVILVVPRTHVVSFPKDYRVQIMTLMNFITHVKEKQC